MLEGLFPDEVATAWGDPSVAAEPLPPEEAAIVAGSLPKRVAEFSKGRECARHALARLGISDVVLLPGANREPLWPAGTVGSITHTRGFCAAAAARSARFASIGIDAEPDSPLERHLAARACTAEELARLEGTDWLDPLVAARVAFSAKESVYKLQFPLTREYLGFSGVSVELGRDGAFDAVFHAAVGRFAAGSRLQGQWRRRNGWILTALWL